MLLRDIPTSWSDKKTTEGKTKGLLGLHEKLEGETSLFRKMNCIRRDIEEYTFVLTCSQIFLSLLQNFSIGSTHMYRVSDWLQFDMDHKNRKQCTTPGGGEISPFLTGVKKYKTSTKRTAQSHCQTSCKTAVVTPPRTSNLRSISYWIIGSGGSHHVEVPISDHWSSSCLGLHFRRDYCGTQHGHPENHELSWVVTGKCSSLNVQAKQDSTKASLMSGPTFSDFTMRDSLCKAVPNTLHGYHKQLFS